MLQHPTARRAADKAPKAPEPMGRGHDRPAQPPLDRHGLRDQPINVRLSGCPNGCSRPYLGEIALVGKAPGRYNLMLGADHRGQRLNRLYRENVDEAAILSALDPLLADYAAQRTAGEYFGDYLVRAGVIPVPARDDRTIGIEVVA